MKSALKNCMIYGLIHYSDECKVLGEFGTKYAVAQSTNNHGRNPIPRKRFQKKQENHTIRGDDYDRDRKSVVVITPYRW